MNIALVEPNLSGHHRFFLSAIADVLVGMQHKVTVYSTSLDINLDPTVRVKYISYKENSACFHNFFMKKIYAVGGFLCMVKNYSSLSRMIDSRIDLVFFCSMDDYMHEFMPKVFFEKIFPFRFSGLLLSPRRSCFYKNTVKSRYCSSVGVLDEFFYDQHRKCRKIIHFPDFTDESSPNMRLDLVQEIRERAAGRKIVLLIGGIVPRKGIFTYIETADRMKNFPCFFVMAGQCSFLAKKEYLFIVNAFANRPNCFFYGERLQDEADFNALIFICDIIYAAYVNFTQSSNMLAKSSLFRKPIIVSKGAYMDEIVKKYKMGKSIHADSSEDCMMAIIDIINSTHGLLGANWDSYYSKNRKDALLDSFKNVFRLTNFPYDNRCEEK